MALIRKTFQFGKHEITLETGMIAKQATSSIVLRSGDTFLLITVVANADNADSNDFFPLTVNYIEKAYAAGKIPGGFTKREGKPSDNETLIARLIDRPIRPLFPEGFTHEVQIVVTVMSLDPSHQPDIFAIIGASAALAMTGLPFKGPLAAARVGYKDGQYLLNPDAPEMAATDLDLVVAGTDKAVLMVESEAKQLPEDVMLGAVMFGHRAFQPVIEAIKSFADEAGRGSWEWQPHTIDQMLMANVRDFAIDKIAQAYATREKAQRQEALKKLRDAVAERFVSAEEDNPDLAAMVSQIVSKLEEEHVRENILSGKPRIDGRDTKTVRPIDVQTGLLPRVHGSALFTRGETQAIVTATLGTEKDSKLIDDLGAERRESFMLHYNFPPYCVGETGMMGSPRRREIGHGRLARRGVQAVMPNATEFPYTIRIVSEITESNGSSSMASVCGSSLALMDAGVPLKAPVAGIAMGLIKEGNRFAVISDILGDEDHLGDMDFKVAGTENGITALQMDIKIDGITEEIMKIALDQAKAGRLHILDVMNRVIDRSREQVSTHAPRITTIKINPDKIREVIGKGGATIREITESTGTTIDITDDGTIKIAATDNAAAEKAKARIEAITAEVEVGKTYVGKVAKIMDFGAFVTILPGKDGLVHISQIAHERVANVSDFLQEGQEVRVKVLEIDRQGKIRLSMKELIEA